MFRKSSYSGAGNNCVEFDIPSAERGGGPTRVRDSKNTAGPTLEFRGGAVTAFLAGLRQGR